MAFQKFGSGALIAITIVGMFLTVTTAGLLSTTQTLPSAGTITAINLGIYSDIDCTVPITSINWGTLSPGAQTTKMIYVKNTGNVAETLSMTTNTWTPSNAATYLTITWSPQSTSLTAGASTSAMLTLSSQSGASVLSAFSVNIVITGTQN